MFSRRRGRHPYWESSLQMKMILNHVLLLIIPISLVFYILFGVFTELETAKEKNLRLQMSLQAAGSIDNTVASLEALTTQPLYDQRVISLLKENRLRIDRGADPGFSFEEETIIGQLLTNIRMLNSSIHSVFLFNTVGVGLNRMRNNQLLFPYNPVGEPWFQLCLSSSGEALYFPSEKYPPLAFPEKDNFYVFSVARAIIDPSSVDLVGVMRIYADVKFLRESVSSLKRNDNERALLLDRNGVISYDTEEKNVGLQYSATDLTAYFTLDSGQVTELAQSGGRGARVHVTVATLSRADLYLVMLVPEANYYADMDQLWRTFALLSLVFVLLSLIISIAVSYGITRPLKQMIVQMGHIGEGDLTVRLPVRHHDEIGKLGQVFNRMMGRIDTLVNENHVAVLRKKEAELNALQAQINPHFLYNTLEAIRMTSLINGDRVTSKMVLQLGKLMRYSISSEGEFVTVAREVEHLFSYVGLQNLRFDDKIHILVSIPPEHMELQILRMTLQPLVENSIYHGFPQKKDNCTIELSSSVENSLLVLTLRDNGVGMSASELEALSARLTAPAAAGGSDHGIGVENVNDRIRLFYGADCGLRIYPAQNGGLCVDVRIPLRESGAL